MMSLFWFANVSIDMCDGDHAAFADACRESHERGLASDRLVAWIAWVDAREAPHGVAATLTLLVRERLPTPTNLAQLEGYVVGVVTAPAWRGRGLGTRLLELAVAESRRRGLARLRLHATSEGRRLYERVGFRPRDDGMELVLGP